MGEQDYVYLYISPELSIGRNEYWFTLTPHSPPTGGIVLHSGTNLIPNNDFITSVQHITSSTTITIQCTSHQQPHWRGPNGQILSTIQNNTLHQILNGNTSILTIDTNNLNNFTNGRFSCNTTQHTANVNLYIGPGGEGRYMCVCVCLYNVM